MYGCPGSAVRACEHLRTSQRLRLSATYCQRGSSGGRPSNVTSPRETPSLPLQPGPVGSVMKLFRVRAQRRKTDNWLQRRKSGPTRPDPSRRPATRILYPQAFCSGFPSFSARSPITEAVKQRIRLQKHESYSDVRVRLLDFPLEVCRANEALRSISQSVPRVRPVLRALTD